MHRRAPEIAPGDGPGEPEEGVPDAVLGTDHPPELGLEGSEGFAEGHELESTSTLPVGPGHGAPEDEGRGLEIFLGGAFHVGGYRRRFQLLIVALASADGVVLLLGRHGVEAVEIVQPLLNRREAGTVQTRTGTPYQGGSQGVRPLWILGTVLVSGEIQTGAVSKPVHGLDARECRRNCPLDCPAAVQQISAVVPPQPAPECRRRGR